MHQPPAGRVVGAFELLAIADPRDADPLAAVVGLHEQRVADLLGDGGEIEGLVVPARRVGEARVVRRLLVGHHHRRGDLQPEPQQRAVRRVLLHRLEGERAVEQVDVVHQRHLLQPLAGQVVPPREAVDDEPVARAGAEVERLDRDPLAGEVMARAVGPAELAQPAEQRLERGRASLPRLPAAAR
jgi:hypothetical protein